MKIELMPRRLLLVASLLLCFVAQATNVDFLLTDSRLNIGQATNRTVYVQPMSTPTVTSSSVVIGTRLTFITDTNGEFTFTNAMTGLYFVSVQGPPSRTDFKILVTATNLGTIYAADCLVADSSATFPAGAVAWSAAVTDLRYSRTTNNLSTYATLVAATNIANTATTALGASLTNALAAQGSIVTNYILSNALLATNYTDLLGTSVTNFVVVTSNALAAQIGSSGVYQPASTTLTNWSLHNTNDYLATNVFQSFTNTLGTASTHSTEDFQSTNSVLTLLAAFGTNQWYPRANPSNFVTSSITNGFYPSSNPSNFLTAVVTNGLATTNQLTTATNDLYAAVQPTNANLTGYSLLSTNFFLPKVNGVATGLVATNSGSSRGLTVYNGGLFQAGDAAGLVLQNPNTAPYQNQLIFDGSNISLNVDVATNFLEVYVLATNLNQSHTVVSQVGRITKANLISIVGAGYATTNALVSATNTVVLSLTNYYPVTNPSNFFSQTIWATNNPSNIVVTAASSAFWTNGAEWRCVSGSNWFPTVLP